MKPSVLLFGVAVVLAVSPASLAQPGLEMGPPEPERPAEGAGVPAAEPEPAPVVPAVPPNPPPAERVPAPGSASDRTPMENAREHMQRGEVLFGDGRFAEAAQEFMAAYLFEPSSAFLFNAGLAYLQGHDWTRAVEYLRRYVVAEPTAPDREDVEARIREIEAILPSVPIEGTPPETPATTVLITQESAGESQRHMKSLVSVETVPTAARVVLQDADGQVVAEGAAPLSRTLSQGNYLVVVDHPDYRSVRMPLVVNPGQVHVFHIEMSQGDFIGFLRVGSNVAGADVFLDDRDHGPIGTVPWGDVVPAGEHTVWVSEEGYETAERAVEVTMGRSTEVVVDIERVAMGEIAVLTNVEGATVAVDGVPAGVTRSGTGLEPGVSGLVRTYESGSHVVTVSAEDMKDYTQEIDVERGRRTTMAVRLNPTPSRVSAWVTFSIAGACYIAGGVFGWLALDLNDQIQADRTAGRLDNADPRILEDTLWAAGADVSFLAGTVMTALGFYYLFRDPLPESEGRLRAAEDFSRIEDWTPAEEGPTVQVSPGPGPLGIGLEVRF